MTDQSNHKIRKIDISTGEVTTLIRTADTEPGHTDGTDTEAIFNIPYGITSDGTNIYVADQSNHNIRNIDISTGEVTTLTHTACSETGKTEGND